MSRAVDRQLLSKVEFIYIDTQSLLWGVSMRMLKEEFRETFLFKRMPKGKECERTRRPVPRKRHSFLALRKDGLCRRRPESPRPLEDGDRHWYKSAMDGDISEIKYLLERDPDMVDKKDSIMGFTALHWAAKKGYIEMTELLAGTGMDVNIKTRGGYTALHFAVIHYHEAIISILVDDYGANINIRDNSGRKPKHYLKDNTSPWIQRKLGKSVKLSVSFSKNGALAKGLGTFGNLLVPASPLSSSLETGLNDIGIDDDNGEQNASNTQRRGSFVKFCQSLRGKTKRGSTPSLELLSEDAALKYHRTHGRAKSAPNLDMFTLRTPMRSLQAHPP